MRSKKWEWGKDKVSHHEACGFYAEIGKKSVEGFEQRADVIRLQFSTAALWQLC